MPGKNILFLIQLILYNTITIQKFSNQALPGKNIIFSILFYFYFYLLTHIDTTS